MSSRRSLIARAFAGTAALCAIKTPAFAEPEHPDPKWHEAAVRMRQLAESWGDQSYGAVLVAEGAVVGEGPSRVVKDKDQDAHAERVAIRDAQRHLYSTSRPCGVCEAAAACARVSRMYFGQPLQDAGIPLDRAQ